MQNTCACKHPCTLKFEKKNLARIVTQRLTSVSKQVEGNETVCNYSLRWYFGSELCTALSQIWHS